jgi:hypothetical protein
MKPEVEYQAPMITDIGSLHEVTLQFQKVSDQGADYHYAHHFTFNHSG